MTTAVSYLIESADSTEDMNLFMIEEPARTTAASLSVKKKEAEKK